MEVHALKPNWPDMKEKPIYSLLYPVGHHYQRTNYRYEPLGEIN